MNLSVFSASSPKIRIIITILLQKSSRMIGHFPRCSWFSTSLHPCAQHLSLSWPPCLATRLFHWSCLSCSTGFRGRSRAIRVHVAGSCCRGLPLDGLRCRGRLLSCPCCFPSSFPVVRLCCCLKRTTRPIGRDTPLSPGGLTSFLLSVGDEGQGTTLLLTPPARARTRWDYAWKENGFAFPKNIKT